MFNLEDHKDFERALKKKINMPFMFGPVEFKGLSLSEEQEPFDYNLEREKVISSAQRSTYLPLSTCIHGFKVCVKNRNLKRRSSLLKHSRFLKNLEVRPIRPPIVETKNEEEENEDSDN